MLKQFSRYILIFMLASLSTSVAADDRPRTSEEPVGHEPSELDIRFVEFWERFQKKFDLNGERSELFDFLHEARHFPYHPLAHRLLGSAEELLETYQDKLKSAGISHDETKRVNERLHVVLEAIYAIADQEVGQELEGLADRFSIFLGKDGQEVRRKEYALLKSLGLAPDSLEDVSLPALELSIYSAVSAIDFDERALLAYPQGVSAKTITSQRRRDAEELSLTVDEEVSGRLEDMMSHIREHWVGQEELKGRVENMLRTVLLFEGQEVDAAKEALVNTNSLVLMGSSGTGRKGFVKLLVDAIYGYEGAWSENLYIMSPVVRLENLGTHLGSSTGFIGSDQIPRLLKYVVDRSGDDYHIDIVEGKGPGERDKYIVKRKVNRSRARTIVRLRRPVFYIENFSVWSRDVKENFLLPLLNGEIEVRNVSQDPKTGEMGEEVVRVKPLVIFGSDAAAQLYSGFSEQVLPENAAAVVEARTHIYERYRHATAELMEMFAAKKAGLSYDSSTPEELVAAIPEAGFVLMEPYHPETLEGVTKMLIADIALLFYQSRLHIEFDVTEPLIRFVANYRHVPSDEGSRLTQRVLGIVSTTVSAAQTRGSFKGLQSGTKVLIDIAENPDQSRSLVFYTEEGELAREPIAATLVDVARPFLSDEKIKRITEDFPARVNSQVYGVGPIVDQVVREILIKENELAALKAGQVSSTGPMLLFLTSLTSGGKTLFAKNIAWARYPENPNAALVENFAKIKHPDDIRHFFLGTMNGENFVESTFHDRYRKTGGSFVLVMDEITNSTVPTEYIAYALYDVLREPVITLANGKTLDLSRLTIVMTSNLGQHIYKAIPPHIHPLVKQFAYQEIHRQAYGTDMGVYGMLINELPKAFIARVGLENFHVFGPLGFDSIRHILQLKVAHALTALRDPNHGRYWNVSFASVDDYFRFLELAELYVYNLEEQGASLDKIGTKLFKLLESQLLSDLVPVASEVTLRTLEVAEVEASQGVVRKVVQLEASYRHDESQKTFVVDIPGLALPVEPVRLSEDRKLTAIHEAGHAIVEYALFHDAFKQTRVSIVEGFGMVNGRPTLWDGIASSIPTVRISQTRQVVLFHAAVFAAGHVAQSLASWGGVVDAGHSNDFFAAKNMIRAAILENGLAHEAFGLQIGDKLQDLSAEQRTILNREVDRMLNESIKLARAYVLRNFTTLLELARYLAAEGELDEVQLREFYANHHVHTYDQSLPQRLAASIDSFRPRALAARLYSLLPSPHQRNAVIHPGVPAFQDLADSREIMLKKRREVIGQPHVRDGIPIVGNSCEQHALQ